MEKRLSTGWMKLALRSRICTQCEPGAKESACWEPRSCESECSLFAQLPRLARFLKRHHSKPPQGYEEFAIDLLSGCSIDSARFSSKIETRLDVLLREYAYDTLAILETVSALTEPTPGISEEHNCLRQDLALGQLSVICPREQRAKP